MAAAAALAEISCSASSSSSHSYLASAKKAQPTNLSLKPTTNPLRIFSLTLHHRHRQRHPRSRGPVLCSVAPNSAPPVITTSAPSNDTKRECFGVFCTTYDLKAEEETKSWKKLINISVSGAAGMISNHLLFKLASGEVFGTNQPIALKLLGSERSFQALEGVAMELEDSLYPLLREVSIGIDPYEVFQDAEWALLIGAKPRGPGMERADLLDINGQIFAEQCTDLSEKCTKYTCKELPCLDKIR